MFAGDRWAALASKGARLQRPLWASTSTKNPAYRDVVYVEELIGPNTVNTMPPATVDAFQDHGVVERTVDRNLREAQRVMDQLGRSASTFAR
jgi:transaldolase